MKKIIFSILAIFFLAFSSASLGYDNPNLPRIELPTTVTITTSSSGGNVTSITSSTNCITVSPTTGDVVITFNTSCGGLSSGGTYNETYHLTSQDVLANRSEWFSTFNSTYANLLNQMCPSGQVFNGTLSNGTFVCTTPSASSFFELVGGYITNKTTLGLETTDLILNHSIDIKDPSGRRQVYTDAVTTNGNPIFRIGNFSGGINPSNTTLFDVDFSKTATGIKLQYLSNQRSSAVTPFDIDVDENYTNAQGHTGNGFGGLVFQLNTNRVNISGAGGDTIRGIFLQLTLNDINNSLSANQNKFVNVIDVTDRITYAGTTGSTQNFRLGDLTYDGITILERTNKSLTHSVYGTNTKINVVRGNTIGSFNTTVFGYAVNITVPGTSSNSVVHNSTNKTIAYGFFADVRFEQNTSGGDLYTFYVANSSAKSKFTELIIDGNVTPGANNTYYFGTSQQRWAWGFFNNITVGDIFFSNNMSFYEPDANTVCLYSPDRVKQSVCFKDDNSLTTERITFPNNLEIKKTDEESVCLFDNNKGEQSVCLHSDGSISKKAYLLEEIPVCDESKRGREYYIYGKEGEADYTYTCAKDSFDSYGWAKDDIGIDVPN